MPCTPRRAKLSDGSRRQSIPNVPITPRYYVLPVRKDWLTETFYFYFYLLSSHSTKKSLCHEHNSSSNNMTNSPTYYIPLARRGKTHASKTCHSPITPNSPLHTNSGCRKREAHINWSTVTCKMAAPVTGTTLRTTGPGLATLCSERHRYAIA